VRTLPILLLTALLLAAPGEAHELQAGPVVVGHPWARPESGEQGYAYLTVRNTGSSPDRLLSASVPPGIAREAKLRAYAVDERGVEVLRRAEAVEAPAGSRAVRLAVRLEELGSPLSAGRSFPLTLSFEKAGEVTAEVAVEETPGHGAAAEWTQPGR
jgi:periplasmic copper chaperone A